jgi:integrase
LEFPAIRQFSFSPRKLKLQDQKNIKICKNFRVDYTNFSCYFETTFINNYSFSNLEVDCQEKYILREFEKGSEDMKDILQDYKNYLAVKYRKDNTRNKYYTIAKDLVNFVKKDNITQKDIDDYLADLNTRENKRNIGKLSYNTIANHIIGIRLFLDFIGKPELKPKIKQYKDTNRDTISIDEIIKIGEIAKQNPETDLIFRFIIDLKARPNEICEAKFSNLKGNKFFFDDTKTGDNNIPKITPEFIESLENYKKYRPKPKTQYEDYILIIPKGKYKGKKYSKRANIVRDAIKFISINAINRKITPYDLRASAMTQEFNNYVNPKIIQRMARHKNLKTTLKYNHVTDKQVEEYITEGTIFNRYKKNLLPQKKKLAVINDNLFKPSGRFILYII